MKVGLCFHSSNSSSIKIIIIIMMCTIKYVYIYVGTHNDRWRLFGDTIPTSSHSLVHFSQSFIVDPSIHLLFCCLPAAMPPAIRYGTYIYIIRVGLSLRLAYTFSFYVSLGYTLPFPVIQRTSPLRAFKFMRTDNILGFHIAFFHLSSRHFYE